MLIYGKLRQLSYYIYLFIIISILFIKKRLKFLKENLTVTDDLPAKWDNLKMSSWPPHHISLMFTEKSTLNMDFIFSFIYNALSTGIKQLSFCGRILNSDFLCNVLENFESDKHILQLDGLNEIDKNKARLINSCKMFSKFENQLKIDDVVEFFYGAKIETDYFLIVGSNLHIDYGFFPIWALRTAELHSISNCRPFSVSQFYSLINIYNQRQRRFGH